MYNNEESRGLIGPASNEIISTTIDLSVDYAELSLDSFLETGILKEIPFVKSIYAIYKIGAGIKEFHFTKKFMTFLREYHSRTISEEKLIEFKNDFHNDKKYREKITESLIVYNDAFLQVEKSKILAKLFASYVEGTYDWGHFNHLSTCLNSAHPKIFAFLEELSQHNFEIPENSREDFPLKLDMEAMVIASGLGYSYSSWSAGFELSELGKDLYNYGLR
ncbi:hypothetical protein IM793_23395 [Pedobacter sp. MR2016-19]|uniref:hypothetical protein n=1 Tax=Pedobacter sp. MR2016-19 TaxID=2780089 RepID=UPI001873B264|nr:hypothetical protein [Pedobacter sp. MR2016-19]MBE5322119.1 hypothetical protein [Pedobacter sp. MR2016-19]